MSHLVFYDGTCGLCDRVVQFVLAIDKQQIFQFAPIGGETFACLGLSADQDTLILVQDYKLPAQKTFIRSKAAFTILWLIGGIWKGIGWLRFLPAAPFDVVYRVIARYRHRLFPQKECQLPRQSDRTRFLP